MNYSINKNKKMQNLKNNINLYQHNLQLMSSKNNYKMFINRLKIMKDKLILYKLSNLVV